jgi:3-hydroxyisobutyrate dehydrogenase-like beta-hydroxyacid dehydrogenase
VVEIGFIGLGNMDFPVARRLPSLDPSLDVATSADGVIEGPRVKRYVDLSTVGS